MEKVTSSVGTRVATLNLWGRGTLVHSTCGGSRMWVWEVLTCTKVHAENRTPVWRKGLLSVRPYGHESYGRKDSVWT
jgi:hypothetical protein